jgi:tetratricopeptide (TPR) repeat protein
MAFARAAVALRPQDSQGVFLIGRAFESMGRDEESLPCFRKAIELAPSRGAIYIHLADVLVSLRKFDEANVNYNKSIEVEPKAKYHHLHFAEGLRRQGKLDEAIARLRTAMAMDPEVTDPQTTDLYEQLGEYLNLKSQLDESIVCFEQFLKWRPTVTWNWARLGQLYAKKGEMGRAMECHRQAISNWKNNFRSPIARAPTSITPP